MYNWSREQHINYHKGTPMENKRTDDQLDAYSGERFITARSEKH